MPAVLAAAAKAFRYNILGDFADLLLTPQIDINYAGLGSQGRRLFLYPSVKSKYRQQKAVKSPH